MVFVEIVNIVIEKQYNIKTILFLLIIFDFVKRTIFIFTVYKVDRKKKYVIVSEKNQFQVEKEIIFVKLFAISEIEVQIVNRYDVVLKNSVYI